MAQYFNPFYGRIFYQCIDIPHFIDFFIHQHLGCVHWFAIVNNILIVICEHVLGGHMFSYLSGIYFSMELWNHLFPNQRQHFAFPPAVHECSNIFTSNNFYLGYSHPRECEVVSHFGFDLHYNESRWFYFSCAYLPFVHLLRESSIQVICPF